MTSNAVAALPSPAALAAERDPSKRLLALVEPATNMLIRATALDQVNEIRSQAEAIARYARSIHLSAAAIGAAQTIARRAEVRIGELSGPKPGRPTGGARSKGSKLVTDDLTKDQRHDFRTLAEAAGPSVEDVLGELAPTGQATRAAVLRAVRRDRIAEGGPKYPRDESPIDAVMELEQALRRVTTGLRRMEEHGQAFSAAALARRVATMCREVADLLCADIGGGT